MRRWAAVFLLVFAFGSVLISLRQGQNYAAQDRAAVFSQSSAAHPAGTDALGRDRLLRLAVALLLGLAGAAAASALTTCIAAAVGILAAFAPPFVRAFLLLLLLV